MADESQPEKPASSTLDAPLLLPDDLGIEGAAQLRLALLERVASPGRVVVDGSSVTRVHTAGLQLCCAFWQQRRFSGRETVWQSLSPVLRDSARHLGVAAWLGLDDPTGASA